MSYDLRVWETEENGWAWELTKDGFPVQGGMGYGSEQEARDTAFVPPEEHPEDTENEVL